MTCEELAAQVASLTASLDSIDQQIADKNSDANLDLAAILPGDTYGGTYPAAPPTVSGIQARLNYLNMRQPPVPQTLKDGYNAILSILQFVQNSLMPQRAMTASSLSQTKQQQVDQGC